MKISISESELIDLIKAGLKHTLYKGKQLPEGIEVDLPKSNRDGYAGLEIPNVSFSDLINMSANNTEQVVAPKTDTKTVTVKVVDDKKPEPVEPKKPVKPEIIKNDTGENTVATKPTGLFKQAPKPEETPEPESTTGDVPFEPDGVTKVEPTPVKPNIFANVSKK